MVRYFRVPHPFSREEARSKNLADSALCLCKLLENRGAYKT